MGLFMLGLGAGVGVAATTFVLLSFGPLGASATHSGPGTVHACVSLYTGQARIMLPGRPPACTTNERLIELGSGAAAADVEARLATLESAPDIASRIYYLEFERTVSAGTVGTAQQCLDTNDLVLSGGFEVLGPDGARVTQRFGYPGHRDGFADFWQNAYRFTAGPDITFDEYIVCLAVD